jgi:hypothetical protein
MTGHAASSGDALFTRRYHGHDGRTTAAPFALATLRVADRSP